MKEKMYDDIHPKYGVPRDMVSCPGCGYVYGHHNTKVHLGSEECSSCVPNEPKESYISASKFIERCLT